MYWIHLCEQYFLEAGNSGNVMRSTDNGTMFFGILEDSWEIGFPASFEKHVGMTMDEFYVQFTKFMREGNIDDPPPQGFFPKEPLSKLVDFSSVDSG